MEPSPEASHRESSVTTADFVADHSAELRGAGLLRRVGALLLTGGLGVILLFADGSSVVGPLLIFLSAGVFGLVAPRFALLVLLVGYAFHPFAMRVVAIDGAVGGLPLLVVSAWKEAALAGVLVTVGLSRLRGQPFRHVGIPDYWAGALFLLATIWILLAPDLVSALNGWRLLIFPLGIYVAVRAGVLSAKDLFAVLISVGAVLAVLGLLQSLVLGWTFILHYYTPVGGEPPATYSAQFMDVPRAIATLFSPNELGLLLAIAAVATFVVLPAVGAERTLRRLLMLAFGLILVGTAATVSRSVLFALPIGLLAVVIAAPHAWRLLARRIALPLVLTTGVAVGAIILIYAQTGAFELLASTLLTLGGNAPSADPSTIGHSISLRDAIGEIQRHPLGIGLGTVGSRSLPNAEPVTRYVVESWYFAMGLSLGWPGFLWALTFPLAMIAWAWRMRVAKLYVPLAVLGSVIIVAIVGVLLPTATEPVIAMYVWALIGLGMQAEPRLLAAPPRGP